MPFDFKRFDELPGVLLIEPRVFGDERGWFQETYKRSDFEKNGIPHDFHQDNHSRSTSKGILRGIHFQNDPAAQGKLVRCPVGSILDVAVDLRKGSPTYKKWVSVELSSENRRMLWVPPGFGHGVLTLSDVAEIMYKCTTEYNHPLDRSIRWNDPEIGIDWGIENPVLSEKDAKAPLLKDSDINFTYKAESQ